MHRETGAYHKKFLGHNQKWLTMFFEYLYKFSQKQHGQNNRAVLLFHFILHFRKE